MQFVQCVVYLIQFGLLARKGDGETNREFLVFDVVFFHEVTETLCHMVEQLERRRKGGGSYLRVEVRMKRLRVCISLINLLSFQCRE